MDIVFSLCLPRDEASVPTVRRLFGSSLRQVGVSEECASDVELAVTEACTNVLKHTQGTEWEYEVKLQLHNQYCEIQVSNGGFPFDDDAGGRTEASPSAESGRGIHLMSVLVDELHFVSDPQSGTVVHLVKTLDLDEGSVLARMAVLSPSEEQDQALRELAEKSRAQARACSPGEPASTA
jgi:serine/threonine-protein kinase RsbW